MDEIKKAAGAVSMNEREELLSWLLDLDDDWDRQMAKDAAAGKLDFLIEEARTAVREETLRDWPKPKIDLEDDAACSRLTRRISWSAYPVQPTER